MLYDYEVKDIITIKGEGTKDVELIDYQESLLNKLDRSLSRYYKKIHFKKGSVPEEGTALLLGTIRPELKIKDGKTICSIWYYCNVFKDKKNVREISKIEVQGYAGDKLSEDKVLTLIAFTHQEMIDKITKEVAKAEK